MARSKLVLTWCFRVMWREDPALQRFQRLEASRKDQARAAVPVFCTQRA